MKPRPHDPRHDPRWDQNANQARRQVLLGIQRANVNLSPADMICAPAPSDRPRNANELGLHALIDVFAKQMSVLGQIDCKSFGDPEAFIRALHRQFAPRDFVEQTMLAEALLLYGRLLHLSQMATRSVLAPQAFELHAAADRVAASLRASLKNLADHRRPTPTTPSVSIAQMFQSAPHTTPLEIPQNPKEPPLQTPYEQGSLDEKTPLPPLSQGFTLPQEVQPQTPAVSEEHRPQVLTGQDDILA